MKSWELLTNIIKEQGVEYAYGIGDTDLQWYAHQTEGLKGINLK